MTNVIRTAIVNALPREAQSGQYSRYVDAAVSAVENLRTQAANSIARSARSAGVDSQQVQQALIESGLVDRPAPRPTPAAPQAQGSEGAGAAVSRLEAKVDRLIAAAEARGLRI